MELKNKKMTHPDRKNFITARAITVNTKKVITISLGVNVCDIVDFKMGDRVNVFLHKQDKNLFLIKKVNDDDGYKLCMSGFNSSFLTFQFRYKTEEQLRLSQVIVLGYETSKDMIIINIENLKWRN